MFLGAQWLMGREARDLFDRMSERNVIDCAAVINVCFNMQNFKDGFGFLLEMRLEDECKN